MFGDLVSLDFGGGGGSSGFDWGSLLSGFGNAAKDVAVAAAPGLAGAAAGFGLNELMPGKPAGHTLVDTRQDITRQGAGMALNRAQNIQQNPTGFGLPGDPYDPNSPAGKRRYDIIKGVRSADAARQMFTTGGSAVRETNALNTAVGNAYDNVWNSSMNTLASQPAMGGYQTAAQENPWGQLLAGAVNPAVSKGMQALLANWGMSA